MPIGVTENPPLVAYAKASASVFGGLGVENSDENRRGTLFGFIGVDAIYA